MKNFQQLFSQKFHLISLILVCIVLICSKIQAAEATFVWSPNTEQNLAGYNIYYGFESGIYAEPINVGNPYIENNSVTATLSGLEEGNTYYFAATAYDINGFESNYSQEVVFCLFVYTQTDVFHPY